MLVFKGTDLAPVLAEALANKCRLLLVKDHGVYFMAEKGEADTATKRRKHIAYAQGCNPHVDKFDDWWERGQSEMGGDDCVEYFETKDRLFKILRIGAHDLTVIASESSLQLALVDSAS